MKLMSLKEPDLDEQYRSLSETNESLKVKLREHLAILGDDCGAEMREEIEMLINLSS